MQCAPSACTSLTEQAHQIGPADSTQSHIQTNFQSHPFPFLFSLFALLLFRNILQVRVTVSRISDILMPISTSLRLPISSHVNGILGVHFLFSQMQGICLFILIWLISRCSKTFHSRPGHDWKKKPKEDAKVQRPIMGFLIGLKVNLYGTHTLHFQTTLTALAVSII